MARLKQLIYASLLMSSLVAPWLPAQALSAPPVRASSYEQRRGQPPSDPASHPLRGGYLPSSLISNVVSDPAHYHVRPAPPGYRWVHVGHDLLLIQERSGLIVDLVEGGYD